MRRHRNDCLFLKVFLRAKHNSNRFDMPVSSTSLIKGMMEHPCQGTKTLSDYKT